MTVQCINLWYNIDYIRFSWRKLLDNILQVGKKINPNKNSGMEKLYYKELNLLSLFKNLPNETLQKAWKCLKQYYSLKKVNRKQAKDCPTLI